MLIANLVDHPACIPTVASWIYTEFIETLRPSISLDDITTTLRARQRTTPPLTYVALHDDLCTGTVSLVCNDLKARQELTPWLASLYVSVGYRRHGLAHQLIDHVIDAAAGLGFRTLYLRTETAAVYYTRLGWQKIDVTTDEFGLLTEVFKWDIMRGE